MIFEHSFQELAPSGLRTGEGPQILMGINFGMVSLMLFILGNYVIKLQRNSIHEIEDKNKALTESEQEREMAYQELLAQEEELRQNTEELMVANETLNETQGRLQTALEREKAAKAELEHSKNSEIAKKNLKITQSIRAAQRIQEAMLPEASEFKKAFANSFIYYRPRDIVSGDVYWSHIHEGKHIVAAVDCTGHGVPGAILSMIAFEQLVEIVSLYEVTDPGEILTRLHNAVRNILKQDKRDIRDGMDIAICTYDPKNGMLEYSGARRPLFYITSDQPFLIPGDRKSIGDGLKPNDDLRFKTHRIQISTPTAIYIYSDGYQDQFGGELGKKFMGKQMRELLLTHHTAPMDEQVKILSDAMTEWQGSSRQIDDMLVIGARLPF